MLETVPAVVVVLDAEGRVVAFNCAAGELSGHGDEDVAGCDVWETGLIREEDQLGTRESFDHLRAGDFPNRSENRWITEGGQRRLLSWRNSAVLGDDGEVSYVVDVTDERRALGRCGSPQSAFAPARSGSMRQSGRCLTPFWSSRTP